MPVPSKVNTQDGNMFKSLIKDSFIIRPSYARYSPSDYNIYNRMMSNLSITSPVFKLIRDLTGRNIDIKATEQTDYDYNALKEIRARFANVKGWQYFIEQQCLTPFVGITIFEKVYWIDPIDDILKLKELIQVPIQYIRYDTNIYRNGYYIEVLGQRVEVTPSKFVLSVYNPTVEYPFGQSIFGYGMVQAFKDLESMEDQLRQVQRKFGAAVPIFGYDPEEATTPEGRANIEERANMIASMNDMSVIGVPLNGRGSSVKESFQFIDMSQLKSELHEFALSRLDDKIELFLSGALFAKGDRGSFARDAVQENEKNRVTEHLGAYVSSVLNDLLNYDALLYGYDPYAYSFVLEQEKSQAQIYALEKLEAESRSQQGDACTRLAEATSRAIPLIGHLKFLNMDNSEIAKLLEVRIELVNVVPAKELLNIGSDYTGQNLPQTDVNNTNYADNKNKNINN